MKSTNATGKKRRGYRYRDRILELMDKEKSAGLNRKEKTELLRLQREGSGRAFHELAQNPPSSDELKRWNKLTKRIAQRLSSSSRSLS